VSWERGKPENEFRKSRREGGGGRNKLPYIFTKFSYESGGLGETSFDLSTEKKKGGGLMDQEAGKG